MKASLALLSLAGITSQVYAHPTHVGAASKPGISRRSVDINGFRLPLTGAYVDAATVQADPPVTNLLPGNPVDTATELVKKIAPDAEFRVVEDHYVGNNGVTHVNFKQTVHGLDIDNANFNVNVGLDGSILSYGDDFYKGSIPDSAPVAKRDTSDPVQALKTASDTLQLPVEANGASAEPKDGKEIYVIKGAKGANAEPEAKLVYFVKEDGELALTWRVETDIVDNWLLTYVDAETNSNIHGVVDYVADVATYKVYPWGFNDPSETDRIVVTDPWDSVASEFTWINDGSTNYTTTRGNNGIAQTNPSGGSTYLNNYRPDSPSLKFEYDYSPSMTNPSDYVAASVTQLFYTANKYHDLLYALGFTEKAGNFEVNNNGQGGKGADMVILNAQDGSGTNNANFATPPDGQSGRMRMYLWTATTPKRDCSFEAGVIIHEYTHGLSNRLTGGPSNTNCLSSLESGGMGEGWGDYMATAIRLKPKDTRSTDYAMGTWVLDDPAGIRAYPYSTSMDTNPLVYTNADSMSGVHDIGTIWASMLYEVLWNLIDKHGKNDAGMPSFDAKGVPTDGKYLAMKLVVDGMALQPCNPNFVQARDAIIDADKALTGGENACEIWAGFAKRGLGKGAVYSSQKRTGSFVVPTGC